MTRLLIKKVLAYNVLFAVLFFVPFAHALTWEAKPSIINARVEASVVQYRDDLYVFNGFKKGLKLETTVEKFDAATHRWSVIASTSIANGSAVTHNGIVRHGVDVWLLGGRVGNHPGAVSNKVWIFNLNTHQWRRGPDMPAPVAGGGAAIVNNKIHWIGGLDANANCDVDNHFVYDFNLPTAGWQDITSVAAMPSPRNHFATVALDGLIYTFGGQYGHDNCPGKRTQDTPLLHVFNPETNVWTQKADMPTIQSHNEPGSFAYLGYIYAVGGESNGTKIYRYDPVKDQWATIGLLPQKRVAPVSRIIDGQLFVVAGGVIAQVPLSLARAASFSFPSNLSTTESNSSTSSSTTENTSVATDDTEHSLISIEAEYFDKRVNTPTHQWISKPLSGASNNNAMITTPNVGALRVNAFNSPMMSYFVYINKPGKYYLWVRGWGDTNAAGLGSNDSVHAGVDGSLVATADKIEQFPAGWNWSRDTRDNQPASITIGTAGLHAINLWMREDALAVDKLVLTTDATYVPSGQGPAETDGSDSNSSTTSTTGNSEDDSTDDSADDSSDDTSTSGTESSTSDDGSSSGNTDTSDNSSTTTESDSSTTNVIQSDNGLVVIEIESADASQSTSTHQWKEISKSGASGSRVMQTTPDNGAIRFDNNNTPALTYKVNFESAGRYTVWLRGWGDTVGNEGKSDSVHVGINNSLNTAKAVQNFPGRWTWSNEKRGGGTAVITVPSKGQHSINIWMREDGLILDKLILVQDTSYVPTGTGPSETVSTSGSDTTGSSGSSDDSTTSDSSGTTDDSTTTDSSNSTNTSSTSSDGSTITIQMESYTSLQGAGTHTWVKSNQQNSDGGAMVTSPNNGAIRFDASNSPVMKYQVNFTAAGTYSVWLRGWGDTVNSEGKNDSVHVGLDGVLSSAKAIQNFPAGWSWSTSKRGGGVATIVVAKAGLHTVNVWMREDGLILDKMMLSSKANFHPDNTETATDDTSENDDTSTDSSTHDYTASATRLWSYHQTRNGSKVIARHESGGVAFNGKIYVLGGRGTRKVSVFDPTSNSWQHKSAPPVEFNHFQPVVWNNKIWVVAAFTGNYPDETPVANIYTYTPANDTWAIAGTIPQQRRRGSAAVVVYNNKFYIAGGNTEGHRPGAKAWFDEFNPATGQWTILPNVLTARDHATVAISNNKLVVAGGRQTSYPQTFSNTVATTDVYNFATKQWSKGANIPTQRAGTMTVAVGGEVVVIGGEALGQLNAQSSVEAYNAETNKWRKLKSLNTGRHSGAAVVLDNKIHVISGSEHIGGAPESTVHEVLLLD